MNKVTKKIMIYSLAGIMQLGIGASVIEASPVHNEGASQRIVQLDDRHGDHDRRQREEQQRHEREMRRHHHESEREWHNRQEREQRRHDNTMHEIEAGLIGIIIGSALN